MKGEDMMFNEIKNASIYSIYIYYINYITIYCIKFNEKETAGGDKQL